MPKNVGNYVGFTTDGTGTTIDAKGVWNTIDAIRYQRNDKWPIVTNVRASGGEVVEDTDSSRVWHVFALPGADPASPAPFTFTTTNNQAFDLEILCIGGGGSGGDTLGGGGGAGGIVHVTGFPDPGNVPYSITVGAGGEYPGTAAPSTGIGDAGDNTTIAGTNLNLTGLGGGGGGFYGGMPATDANDGGSGGGSVAGPAGAADQPTQPTTATGGTVNKYGSAGSQGPATDAGAGGGAGGAGQAGADGGLGGAGQPFTNFPGPKIAPAIPTTYRTDWTSAVGPTGLFGGGGGGGAGNGGTGGGPGPGGGGNGGYYSSPVQVATPGVDGTGGGGGGGGYQQSPSAASGDGGDGIVIITYTAS